MPFVVAVLSHPWLTRRTAVGGLRASGLILRVAVAHDRLTDFHSTAVCTRMTWSWRSANGLVSGHMLEYLKIQDWCLSSPATLILDSEVAKSGHRSLRIMTKVGVLFLSSSVVPTRSDTRFRTPRHKIPVD